MKLLLRKEWNTDLYNFKSTFVFQQRDKGQKQTCQFLIGSFSIQLYLYHLVLLCLFNKMHYCQLWNIKINVFFKVPITHKRWSHFQQRATCEAHSCDNNTTYFNQQLYFISLKILYFFHFYIQGFVIFSLLPSVFSAWSLILKSWKCIFLLLF